SRRFFCNDEVAEIGSLLRGPLRPEDEQPAPILGSVRAMYVTGLEMQGTASLVLLTLVGEVALDDIERLGHALVAMCGNDRARLHGEMQHYRTERVVRVADRQRNIALTREGKTVCLQLTFEDLLIDHCLAPGFGEQ